MEIVKSKPLSIKKENTVVTVGTCRSYDEKRPIPSFIRELGTKQEGTNQMRVQKHNHKKQVQQET
tara:strand:+ start:365 stop:559 length:195 start_codon:yes stop_codon:yes gene_type:complete